MYHLHEERPHVHAARTQAVDDAAWDYRNECREVAVGKDHHRRDSESCSVPPDVLGQVPESLKH